MRFSPSGDPLRFLPQRSNAVAARCANGAGLGTGRVEGIRHAKGTVNSRVGHWRRGDFGDAYNPTGPSLKPRGANSGFRLKALVLAGPIRSTESRTLTDLRGRRAALLDRSLDIK
jgi:hypothetical protein